MYRYAAAALLLLACSRRERDDRHVAQVVTPPPAPTPAPVQVYRKSQARFIGGELAVCLEVTSPDRSKLTDWDAAAPLERACELEFPGRAIGSCVTSKDGSTFALYYYSLDAMTDAEHQSCIEIHGTWTEAPEGSAAMRAAHLRRLRKTAGQP